MGVFEFFIHVLRYFIYIVILLMVIYAKLIIKNRLGINLIFIYFIKGDLREKTGLTEPGVIFLTALFTNMLLFCTFPFTGLLGV